jgi:general secretion pathway protein D
LPPDANAQNFTAACTATGTRVKIQPALTTVSLSPNSFNVTLVVNNVTNLAGYQTDLIYNPALLQVSAVAQGAFLGSTGRTVAPVGPVIDNTIGRVTFGAFTFGTAPGPNGSGTLATITIQPRAAGITALHLENLGLADTASNPIASIGDDGQVEITACFGDFNGDHRVDIFDLQMAAGHWNCRTGDACYDSRFDVIANGVIDVMDLQRIASAWGTVCGTLQESLGVSTAPALHPQSTSLALLPATAHAAPGAAFAQTVRLEDVANLAAYQADLVYDPALIRVEAVTIGPFLGSTGRTVTPVGPVIDNTAGRVTFGAFSFGTQPGVSGSGDLAVVHFQAMTAGQTTLEVQHPSIADPQGNPLSLADVAGSTVVVSSDPQHRILLPAVLRQP